jgi:ribulose kinase
MNRCNAIIAACAATVLGGALLITAASQASAEINSTRQDVSTTRLKTAHPTGTKAGRNAIFDRWGNQMSAPAGARSAKGSAKTR